MKLPWNKKYITISFHVLATILAAYVLYLIINLAAYTILNLASVKEIAAAVISRIFSVFSVIIIAFVIAYLLDPVVKFYQDKAEALKGQKFKTRAIGTGFTYLTILFLLSMAAVIIIMKIGYGIGDLSFIETIIESINRIRNDLGEFYAETAVRFNEWGIAEFFTNIVAGVIDKLLGWISAVPSNAAEILTAAGSTVLNFMLSMIIAFYFLKDKEQILASIKKAFDILVPSKIRIRVRNFLAEVNQIFEGYIRGQLTDAVIMGVLFSIALSVIGVNFSVLIGTFSGLSNLVPYVGAIFAFILSVSVAFISGSPMKALYAAIAIIVLQQIDSTFIIPKVIGKRVRVSPVLILISLSIGGKMFGIWGMVFAVPVCALIKISLTRYIDKKGSE